jgi:hypothetical protein
VLTYMDTVLCFISIIIYILCEFNLLLDPQFIGV